MQESNFEKGIRQKMDELSFAPTEPVWQKVEARIRPKRRRRFLLILLPLLLLTGSTLWYFTATNETVTGAPVASSRQDSNVPKNTAVTPPQQKEKETFSREKSKAGFKEKTQTITGEATTSLTALNRQKENQTFLKKNNKTAVSKVAVVTKIPEADIPIDEENMDLHALVLQNEIQKIEAPQTKGKNISNPFQKQLAAKENGADTSLHTDVASNMKWETPAADSLQKKAVAAADTLVKTATVDVATATVVDLKKTKKEKAWQWTVQARFGISGLRQSVGDVFAQGRAEDFYAAPSTGSNAPPPPQSSSASTTINNRVSFALGTGVRKRMFKNAFVNAGVQYSQYRTSANVGMQVNADTALMYNGRLSAVSNYYKSSGATQAYTTRLHYIELPLAFEYRLLKLLQVQHGLSAGYLFASNALYFDKGARVFYRSDKWLRKTGVQLFTSVDYRLYASETFTLHAGPQLQWGLLPLQQKEETKKHHLFFAGLQSRIHF